jgi:nitrate reductase beta subunit
VHRLPHLFGDLQERLDQPQGRRIRLVQQRRIEAWHRLSEAVGKPGNLARRLGTEKRQAAAEIRLQAGSVAEHLRQPGHAGNRRLLRAVHLRLRPSAERAAVEAAPTARPVSQITGEKMDKITWGPNWEDDLAGEFDKRAKDRNMHNLEKAIYKQFENTFHMYLPRICNHCINPACVASCPSGSLYKREEDGIVLVDQDKCRGWRMCISSCPYKKVFYNWESGKAEKCIGCYPRVESGMPTVCSESCVGRIRYNGIMLYDADKIEALASVPNEQDLYQAQLDIFLDPNDPEVIKQARIDGIPDDWMEAARKSPIYKMAVEWKIAFPMHPEFRTLPMVWYVPPLSPVQSHIDQGALSSDPGSVIPPVENLRLPVKYLANLLTAGKEAPIVSALKRMIAMRAYQRSVHVEGIPDTRALDEIGMSVEMALEMYRYLAIANYEDRFVIPTGHQEVTLEDFYGHQGQNGFSFGNDSSPGISPNSLFPERRKETVEPRDPAPAADER